MSPSEIHQVRGTVKAAVVEGDSAMLDLVALSYYNQKPVHFLSTICESIKWIQCEKKVYYVKTDQVENMKFLHLNVNDNYNNDMGGCDIADQLRNYYRFDQWMRKCKWLWSFFFWAIGVLLVNTYVAYKTFMHQKENVPMSHYQFRKVIALAWIVPATYWPNRMKRRNGGENSTNNSTTTGTTTETTANSTMGRSTSTES